MKFFLQKSFDSNGLFLFHSKYRHIYSSTKKYSIDYSTT